MEFDFQLQGDQVRQIARVRFDSFLSCNEDNISIIELGCNTYGKRTASLDEAITDDNHHMLIFCGDHTMTPLALIDDFARAIHRVCNSLQCEHEHEHGREDTGDDTP